MAETTTAPAESLHSAHNKKILITSFQSEQIRIVQDRLKACGIFKKYGCIKTLAFVRESASSIDKCREALVKLTWFASKRSNSLQISEWIQLMKDLQWLQTSLYGDLIGYQECSEIFLSSLLGSRNIENIKLAYTWLLDIFMCDKEGAVDLTVRAAQEYFNASSNYFDPDMEFAKECLELVKNMILESKSMVKLGISFLLLHIFHMVSYINR